MKHCWWEYGEVSGASMVEIAQEIVKPRIKLRGGWRGSGGEVVVRGVGTLVGG